MKCHLRSIVCVLLLAGFARGAGADPTVVSNSALYDALGGNPGIAALVETFTARLVSDPRSAPMFQDVDLAKLKTRLREQFCEVSGGPCVYKGKDMETAHAGVDITKAHFNAVVEMLQDAMDGERVAFRDQNRLLARLAPMHRQIVNSAPGRSH